MTDYPEALAALREARTKFNAEVARVAGPQTLQHRAEELSARVLDFLDALDAAQPVAWMTAGGDVSRSYAWAAERCMETDPSPLYLAPQAPPAAVAEGVQRHPMYVGMRNRLTSELVRRFELAGNEFARAKAEALVSEYQSALAAALAARKGVES